MEGSFPTRRCSTCSSEVVHARTCASSRSTSSAPKARCRKTLFEVAQREKEIRYSSRTRLNTDVFCELQTIRRAIRRLRSQVPQEFSEHPDWQFLDNASCDAAITIVHCSFTGAPPIGPSQTTTNSRAIRWTSIGLRAAHDVEHTLQSSRLEKSHSVQKRA